MPYNVPIYLRPYICATRPEVNGTVASQSTPITIENTTTVVGVMGVIMKAVAAMVRPTYTTDSKYFFEYLLLKLLP